MPQVETKQSKDTRDRLYLCDPAKSFAAGQIGPAANPHGLHYTLLCLDPSNQLKLCLSLMLSSQCIVVWWKGFANHKSPWVDCFVCVQLNRQYQYHCKKELSKCLSKIFVQCRTSWIQTKKSIWYTSKRDYQQSNERRSGAHSMTCKQFCPQ